jgi:hypothetical protein
MSDPSDISVEIVAEQVAEEMLRLKRLDSGMDAIAYLRKILPDKSMTFLEVLEDNLVEKYGNRNLPE